MPLLASEADVKTRTGATRMPVPASLAPAAAAAAAHSSRLRGAYSPVTLFRKASNTSASSLWRMTPTALPAEHHSQSGVQPCRSQVSASAVHAGRALTKAATSATATAFEAQTSSPLGRRSGETREPSIFSLTVCTALASILSSATSGISPRLKNLWKRRARMCPVAAQTRRPRHSRLAESCHRTFDPAGACKGSGKREAMAHFV
mmetsp:Transcript_30511/g.64906  ORF Transcript_30511/g.64906 Transcript_30511/m.64906 type:complete len:205 (+) Transcript_30511:966-1580(+)